MTRTSRAKLFVVNVYLQSSYIASLTNIINMNRPSDLRPQVSDILRVNSPMQLNIVDKDRHDAKAPSIEPRDERALK